MAKNGGLVDHGGRPKLLRELNGKVLLNIIREQGPLSRPALSKLSGLSLPTVNARMRTLLEMGYVNELGQTKSRGGRPAQLLEFNGEFGYVLGIDVGGYQVSVALADLTGKLVAYERRRLSARAAESGARRPDGSGALYARGCESTHREGVPSSQHTRMGGAGTCGALGRAHRKAGDY